MLNGEDAIGRVGIDGKRDRCGFIKAVMQFGVDGVAIASVDSKEQITKSPIATQSIHAVSSTACHQPFGEEAGKMTHTAYDGAAEEVLVVAHIQHLE